MPSSLAAALVAAVLRARLAVLVAFLALGVAASLYVVDHFAISTDTSELIAANVPWRQREAAFDQAFPQRAGLIVAVVDGATPEAAELAARALDERLSPQTDLIESLRRPDASAFFAREGLLFLPLEELRRTADELIRSQPFLGALAANPSLRGLSRALGLIAQGVKEKQTDFAALAAPLENFADLFAAAAAGRPSGFSWRALFTGAQPGPRDLRKLVLIKPKLDYAALEPGGAATLAIRAAIASIERQAAQPVNIRLTGPVPLADEEFATVADGAALNGAITLILVLAILWLALHSWRIIVAVAVSLFVGLAITAALGLAMVGALNLISVAFAMLFVGLGVDFGLQYGVRYREERHKDPHLPRALVAAAREAGHPLALAAAATAAGFWSFLPTSYRGLSELGLIAGAGMLVAFATSLTLLPALLSLLRAPLEPAAMGYRALAFLDHFLARRRSAILWGTALLVLAGAPMLARVRFDFNPINLRSAKVESVSTYLDLLRDPDTSPNSIDIIEPSLAAARDKALAVAALPAVDHVVTLATFAPEDQDAKLETIQDLSFLIGPGLSPAELPPPPGDAEAAETLTQAARALREAAGERDHAARRLADALQALGDGPSAGRARADALLLPGLRLLLDQTRAALAAEPVTLDDLPEDLRRDWTTPDGRARMEVFPKGDANDNAVLAAFVDAVTRVAPEATGTPVSIRESGRTIVGAFLQAGGWALASITLLLFLVLRRPVDVALTLAPLLLAGVVTLEICGAIDMPLNFANIIALPLLLGVGVAFKVYFVMAWRAGETQLLQSSLTRAVFYSALTTATAFGSLWFSNHPGTASMGRLLALSLMCTLAAAVLFQPALMGPPRSK